MKEEAIKTWVITANSSEAHCYEAKHLGREMNLVKEFYHPESREKGQDLVTDRPGLFQSRDARGGFGWRANPKDVEAEKFAILLAQELGYAHKHNQYKKLILIAPPHFNGLLSRHLDDQVLNNVSHKIDKDYTKMAEKELRSYVDELPRF